MKYKNAQCILPTKLILEIQKYANGEMIYIPKPKDNHSKWGDLSGGKEYTKARNLSIKKLYLDGHKIEQLAQEYHLSIESIKKIAYNK